MVKKKGETKIMIKEDMTKFQADFGSIQIALKEMLEEKFGFYKVNSFWARDSEFVNSLVVQIFPTKKRTNVSDAIIKYLIEINIIEYQNEEDYRRSIFDNFIDNFIKLILSLGDYVIIPDGMINNEIINKMVDRFYSVFPLDVNRNGIHISFPDKEEETILDPSSFNDCKEIPQKFNSTLEIIEYILSGILLLNDVKVFSIKDKNDVQYNIGFTSDEMGFTTFFKEREYARLDNSADVLVKIIDKIRNFDYTIKNDMNRRTLCTKLDIIKDFYMSISKLSEQTSLSEKQAIETFEWFMTNIINRIYDRKENE